MSTLSVVHHNQNCILKQKVSLLNTICEQHKSNYEKMKAKYEMEYKKQKCEYIHQINILQQQLKHQEYKLITMQNKSKEDQQSWQKQEIQYQNELKSLQKQMDNTLQCMRSEIEQNDIIKNDEINELKNELSQKRDETVALHKKLSDCYELYASFRSSPTVTAMKVTKSYASTAKKSISPTPSIASDTVYVQRNHDAVLSPDPDVIFGYIHGHLIPQNKGKRNKKNVNNLRFKPSISKSFSPTPSPVLSESSISLFPDIDCVSIANTKTKRNKNYRNRKLKWSDTIQNTKPAQIDVSMFRMLSDNVDTDDTDIGTTQTSDISLRSIMLKNSDTQMSYEVAVAQDIELHR